MEKLKRYNKCSLKRDHSTGMVMVKDGNPVIDDVMKPGCPLEKRHVDILNRSWKKTGIFYDEVKEQKTVKQKTVKQEAIVIKKEDK